MTLALCSTAEQQLNWCVLSIVFLLKPKQTIDTRKKIDWNQDTFHLLLFLFSFWNVELKFVSLASLCTISTSFYCCEERSFSVLPRESHRGRHPLQRAHVLLWHWHTESACLLLSWAKCFSSVAYCEFSRSAPDRYKAVTYPVSFPAFIRTDYEWIQFLATYKRHWTSMLPSSS